MKVLFVLTYYHPHVSGLTIYVKRLATAMAQHGYRVTVLTSRYDPSLPEEEELDGVRVVRAPVLMRVSKGVLMPTFPARALRLMRAHDVISVHLPQFEASLLAILGRLVRRPVVLTYHCDLQLPAGWFNRIVDRVVAFSNTLAGHLAQAVVAYTQDFAEHSPFLSRFLPKVRVIPPPVIMPPPDPADVDAFRAAHDLTPSHPSPRTGERGRGTGRPVVGMAARLATEKGVEVLIDAMPTLLAEFADLKVLFAGQYRDVMGEDAYYRRLMPLIKTLGPAHWEFLGVLTPDEMPAFFASCDVLVVPSLNSTESFGLVQVEAMLCGTPSIASNLPGVRQPPWMTGMGDVVPIGDSRALAESIIRVIQGKHDYVRPRAEIARIFSLDQTLEAYTALFRDVCASGEPRPERPEADPARDA